MNTVGKEKVLADQKLNQPTTKATIYKSDRELINSYALSLGISVNELLHRIFRNENFEEFFNDIK